MHDPNRRLVCYRASDGATDTGACRRADICTGNRTSALTTANGRKLVTGGDYLGGEIRSVSGNRWVNNRTATCMFYDGDKCSLLERTGIFG